METEVNYATRRLASCDRPERRQILHELLMGRISIDEADRLLEELTAKRILEAQRGLVGDDVPSIEERSIKAIARRQGRT